MLSDLERRHMVGGNGGGNEGSGSFGDELEKEIGMLLRDSRSREDTSIDDRERERELNMYRSGSAPPTVEGSLNAIGGLFNGGGGISFSEFPGGNDRKGFASEEEFRSDPAYLSYYYSNVNLNPRLPPPLVSKEDWRYAQRLKGGNGLGGIGDRRKTSRVVDNGGNRSLFSTPPGFDGRKQENEFENARGSTEWGGADGLIGLPGLGLGSKQKSLAEIIQDDLGHAASVPGHPSRPSSRNAFDENIEARSSAEAELALLRREMASPATLQSGLKGQSSSAVQSIGPSTYSYAAALGGKLSRSTTPDPQLIARTPSPCPTPIGSGRGSTTEKRGMTSSNSFNGLSASIGDSTDLPSAFSRLTLSTNGMAGDGNQLPSQIEEDVDNNRDHLYAFQGGQSNFKQQQSFLKKSQSGHLDTSFVSQSAKASYSDAAVSNGYATDLNTSSVLADRQVELQKSGVPFNNPYLKGGRAGQYQRVDDSNSSLPDYGLGGYSPNPALASMLGSHPANGNLPPLYENAAAASAMAVPGIDARMLGGKTSRPNMLLSGSKRIDPNRVSNQMAGNALLPPVLDPVYLQYLKTSEYAAQLAALNDLSVDRNQLANYLNMMELQKAYLGSLQSPRKSPFSAPMGGKSGNQNNSGFYGNPAFGFGMSYPGSPMSNPMIPNSPVGPGSPLRHNEINMHFSSGLRNSASGTMGPWRLDAGYSMDGAFPSSLLEEFKCSKTKCFELSEIRGHVVEFSTDQYGSRFIQQKLETATTEEKNMVYEEIMPHALVLVTDVFGNYVIQKFFEHGLQTQRRELACKLFGHVLTLSLQMYGCRVIQKAIEVVDLDQKTKMVQELDGYVMRCVRDQNGNHVIQKCIECVPEESIQFIVSTFFNQVLSLSTHPYGCRVIQRVLEHCKDPTTQSKVMDEILGSVSMLAQDQYGNYVVQHVLEHGKPHERSAIIKELAGKIVQMSQQKFASNVVEKCLAFGSQDERQLLVNEMLGSTEENEPLQAMMKDQFANYVVQKVLETCDDQQRELILSRIKVHLNALKKYTYGKHIVARVEKLVAAGERRIAAQSPNPTEVA